MQANEEWNEILNRKCFSSVWIDSMAIGVFIFNIPINMTWCSTIGCRAHNSLVRTIAFATSVIFIFALITLAGTTGEGNASFGTLIKFMIVIIKSVPLPQRVVAAILENLLFLPLNS